MRKSEDCERVHHKNKQFGLIYWLVIVVVVVSLLLLLLPLFLLLTPHWGLS